MTEKNIILNAPNGMHARPAGELVKLVKSLEGVKLSLDNGVKSVNAASMLSILSLGLKNGSSVTVKAEGTSPDAEAAAVETLCSFIEAIKD